MSSLAIFPVYVRPLTYSTIDKCLQSLHQLLDDAELAPPIDVESHEEVIAKLPLL